MKRKKQKEFDFDFPPAPVKPNLENLQYLYNHCQLVIEDLIEINGIQKSFFLKFRREFDLKKRTIPFHKVKEFYELGMSAAEISLVGAVSHSRVREILRKYGVKLVKYSPERVELRKENEERIYRIMDIGLNWRIEQRAAIKFYGLGKSKYSYLDSLIAEMEKKR